MSNTEPKSPAASPPSWSDDEYCGPDDPETTATDAEREAWAKAQPPAASEGEKLSLAQVAARRAAAGELMCKCRHSAAEHACTDKKWCECKSFRLASPACPACGRNYRGQGGAYWGAACPLGDDCCKGIAAPAPAGGPSAGALGEEKKRRQTLIEQIKTWQLDKSLPKDKFDLLTELAVEIFYAADSSHAGPSAGAGTLAAAAKALHDAVRDCGYDCRQGDVMRADKLVEEALAASEPKSGTLAVEKLCICGHKESDHALTCNFALCLCDRFQNPLAASGAGEGK